MIRATLLASVRATGEQAERAAADAPAFLHLREAITRSLCDEVDSEFFPKWRMEPSPFVVTADDLAGVVAVATAVHDAVERLLDAWAADDPIVRPYFERYRFLRELSVKPGRLWQGWGRLDMLIARDGTPVFVETNAAMASGGLPNHYLADAFERRAEGPLRPRMTRGWIPQYDEAGAGRLVVAREAREAPDEGSFAILIDENRKLHEADMLATTLRRAGRDDILIGDVADVRDIGGRPTLHGRQIRTTFNKFRMFGRQHRWSPVAFERNRRYLELAAAGRLHPINCLAAQTVAEDKVVFAALRDPRLAHLFDGDQRAAIAHHTVPTAPCRHGGTVYLDGGEADLREALLAERGEWILKPRNDYRGAGVRSGREVSAAEWRSIVGVCLGEPERWVAQRRVDDVPVTAAIRETDRVALADLRLASGVYIIDGVPYGLVARAGYGEVVNGITGAHMLPIWVGGRAGEEEA